MPQNFSIKDGTSHFQEKTSEFGFIKRIVVPSSQKEASSFNLQMQQQKLQNDDNSNDEVSRFSGFPTVDSKTKR
jgi:hypothetical protein